MTLHINYLSFEVLNTYHIFFNYIFKYELKFKINININY